MTLQQVVASAKATPEPAGTSWAFEAFRVAETFERDLMSPESFRDVVSRLERLAVSLHCTAVAGASRMGERLAGGIASLPNTDLKLWPQGSATDERVLFIDGVVTSGVQLACAIRAARQCGVANPVGAGVIARRSALATRREVGELVALEEI